jgi:hypothetical protein
MSVKHTPGPWQVLDNRHAGGGCTVLVWSPTGDVAEVYGFFVGDESDPPPDDFGLPNAKVIAAAPEVLSALEGVLEYAQKYAELSGEPEGGDCQRAISAALAALAKAVS